jgi:hypothetical protein
VLGHDDFTSPTRVHLAYFGTAPKVGGTPTSNQWFELTRTVA